MSWKSCTVRLNSDSTGSLYAGDIVTGIVTMVFAKKTFIESVGFVVLGFGEAQWSRPRPTVPYIKVYSAKRKLLHIEMDIFGNSFGRIVNPGVYIFPFDFALPEDLPSTFKSSIAKVHYYAKIYMEGMCKPKKIVPFTVLENVNLNNNDDFLNPSAHVEQKTCWNSKFISLSVKTYVAFASKQQIPLELKIVNEKKVKICKIKVCLVQKLRYSTSEGHAEEEKNMYLKEFHKFSNMVYETCHFHMDIPNVTPTSYNNTNAIIQISYVLRVDIVFQFHSTLRKDIPVAIATVPVIHNEFENE